MHRTDVLCADVALDGFDGCGQAICFAQIVTGGESVRRVEADAEPKRRAAFADRAQMLEAMTDARALPGGVLQQDTQLFEIKVGGGPLQALGASAYAVRLAGVLGAAWMHDQIIRTERKAALDLFAKRSDGFFPNQRIGRRQVDQIVRMNDDRGDLCFRAHTMKSFDLFIAQRTRLPAARVAREYLHRVAVMLMRFQERVLQAARNRRMKTDPRPRCVRLLLCLFFRLARSHFFVACSLPRSTSAITRS